MSDINDATKASTATFLTALVANAIVFAVEIGVFTLIRPYFKSIYEPRTYVPPEEKRAKSLTRHKFFWPWAVFQADYRGVIKANGLDAYFYVRFLRVMAIVLLPIWFLSWIILIPLNVVKTETDPPLEGLDRYTFGNIARDKQIRYVGHLILVYIFTFWIFYVIHHEMKHFILTRQTHLISPEHSRTVEANTILVTGIPQKYLTQDALYKVFNILPGGVQRIWINRFLGELPELYDRRMAACNTLESAETKLIRTATQLRLNAAKGKEKGPAATPDLEEAASEVPKEQRPTHRTGFLGLFGPKVDSVEWAREEIVTCTALLEEGRSKIRASDERGLAEPTDDLEDYDDSALDENGNPRVHTGDPKHMSNPSRLKGHAKSAAAEASKGAKGAISGVAKGAEILKARVVGTDAGVYIPLNSAFITFNQQISAHLAVQVLSHHLPYRMSQRYIEVHPSDVIWSNLGLNTYEQKIRQAISYAATAGLIICWAFPVAFVGAVSNIYTVCTTAKWLSWVCDLPDVVVGIIAGILPPVLLAILMMLLPIILRLLARFEGIPKHTGLELSLMTRFFIFQVIHSFLIVTLSSGIVAALPQLINDPTSIPNILAQNLPSASTFFLTYIILQGLAGTAGGFLQIVPLIIYYVKLVLLGSTPRAVWRIKYGLNKVAWGTLFPTTTLLVVITLGYSIISPLINGLACVTFFLFYQRYKYLFLYVYGQPSTTDTGGLFYPKAIQHIFVGLYVQQVCLCALFFLARNESQKPSAIPQGALMIVLIVITAGFNIIIKNSYGPLLSALPLTLKDKTYTAAKPADEVSKKTGSIVEEDVETPPATTTTDMSKKKDEESYGFAHPAISRPQRVIWLPEDVHGLAEKEARVCVEAGMIVSTRNASMNEKGKVDVSGGPPDLIGEIQ